MICKRKFTGALKAGPKVFRPGDPITTGEAKELGLADKSHLAKKDGKRAKPAKA